MRTLKANIRSAAASALIVLMAFALGSCGSASNNDQGVAFTLLGFFAAGDVDGCDLPAGELGQFTPIGELDSSSIVGDSEESGDSGAVLTYLGIQNNLTGQFIRTDRVLLSYYIEGASAQPPSTTLALSSVVGPSVVASDSSSDTEGGATNDPFDSSLPPGFDNESCSREFLQFMVVPPDIRAWINLNKGSLPEAPFVMTATVEVTGLTSAGARLTTNPATYDVIFTPDPIIPPTIDDGADTGGVTETVESGTVSDGSGTEFIE